MEKVETELIKLKKKCLKKDGQPRADAKSEDLLRMKILLDGEGLSKTEIEEAQKREAENKEKEIDDYKKRMAAKSSAAATGHTTEQPDPSLDIPPQPAEHPRIVKLKAALLPFTQLEVQETRADEFIMLNTGNSGKGGSITAGDVRQARRAMNV